MQILIVFETCEGQTKKIASFLKAKFAECGIDAVLFQPGRTQNVRIEDFNGFIVGGPVHIQKFPKALRNWVRKNRDLLAAKPSIFFSVCLGILQKDNLEVQHEEHEIVQNFFMQTGWVAKSYEIFAGALMYSKYGWLKKRMMRRIARKAGMETQMNQDYEFTDWTQVAQFANRFATQIEKSATPSPTRSPFSSIL